MANEPHVVDARGMRCPWPVLRAARALREHDAVEICADDPIAPRELRAFADEGGLECLDLGSGRFLLRR